MLLIQGIIPEKCILCEECVNVCPAHLFDKTVKEMKVHILFSDPYKTCIRCGHCVAICPEEAIRYASDEQALEFNNFTSPEKIVSYEDLYKIMRTRRSIRRYKSEQMPKELLEKVIEAMRYAPTASNRQKRDLVIVTNQEVIKTLSHNITDYVLSKKWVLKFRTIIAPLLPAQYKKLIKSKKTESFLNRLEADKQKGIDRIFFNAPCVIFLHSPPYSLMTANDAGIILTHGMLAAQSLGLGTCWIGFAEEFLWRNKTVRKELGIPDKNKVFGVLTIGFPDFSFKRSTNREKIHCVWKE